MKLIDISTKKFPNTFTMVDDEDFEFLNQRKWALHLCRGKSYAVRSQWVPSKKKLAALRIHRELLKAPVGMQVDYIDGNGLNNQKSNLRVCTNQENCRNRRPYSNGTSKYKGVHWHKKDCKWHARIVTGTRRIQIGSFTSEIEAAKAYNEDSKKLFGEFAYLNKIGEPNGK